MGIFLSILILILTIRMMSTTILHVEVMTMYTRTTGTTGTGTQRYAPEFCRRHGAIRLDENDTKE